MFLVYRLIETVSLKMSYYSSSSPPPSPSPSPSIVTAMALNEFEKPHVLAVDDCLIDRIIIQKLLTNSACKVTTAENAQRALEILGLAEGQETSNGNSSTVSQINLIITDYSMPGMTGYELLKKIKESSSMKDIPVIVVSSDNIPTRIAKCLEQGAQEFLLKPLKQSDVRKLSNLLENLKNLCEGMICIE